MANATAAYTVAEARALNLPRLTLDGLRDLLEPAEVERLEAVDTDALAAYLGMWAIVGEQACPFGHRWVEWGLAHGATRCTECHWPGRAYHYPKLGGDTEVRFMVRTFAHPDDCSDESTPDELGS